MRQEAQLEHTKSLENRTFRTDRTSIDLFVKIINDFAERMRDQTQKAAKKAQKKPKAQEPYRQRSIEELLAAANAEAASTGNREGPAYQAYIEALEIQAGIADVTAMQAEETHDQTWTLEGEREEVEAEEQEEHEAEEEEGGDGRKKKKKQKKPKKKVDTAEKDEEEKPKKKKARKTTSVATVPKANAAILSAIEKGDKEKEKNEGQEVRAHIQNDLMWPTSMKIHLERLYTPHWMWRDRDLTHRHVERIKKEILKTPGKFFKVPIVQPVRLA